MVRFLSDHPAGPLELETRDYDPRQGFELLGYRVDFVGNEPSAEARLSERTLGRLEKDLPKRVEEDRMHGLGYPHVAISYLASVLGSHPEATDRDEWLHRHLEMISEYHLTAPSPFE